MRGSSRSELVDWVRGPVGPWARGLVGAPPAPELVGSWARGPVGLWAQSTKKNYPAAPGLSFSI